MGMFGRARQLVESRPTEPLPNVKTGDGFSITPGRGTKTPARRGAFGRGWLTPERLQVIGATLQQLDGQQGAIADVVANQKQDTLEHRQAKEGAARRRALAAALSTIDDPQLRRLAMMYPEQYARQQFSRTGSEDEWAEPFAFEHGMAQRNSRTGQVRVLTRPQSSGTRTSAPDLPDGFSWED